MLWLAEGVLNQDREDLFRTLTVVAVHYIVNWPVCQPCQIT